MRPVVLGAAGGWAGNASKAGPGGNCTHDARKGLDWAAWCRIVGIVSCRFSRMDICGIIQRMRMSLGQRVFGYGLLKKDREVDTLRARLEYVKMVGLSSNATMGWNINQTDDGWLPRKMVLKLDRGEV